MPDRKPVVLIVEHDPDVRELEKIVVIDAGYDVTFSPAPSDPVAFARESQPDVIVVGIRPIQTSDWRILDGLQADPTTRKIPVVVVSTSEPTAAAAQAAPIARQTVVAPFDIVALEAAVSHALKNPPPAAVLPPTQRPPSHAVAVATEAMSRQARQIVLTTIHALLQHEPYRSRFPELSKGLVDDLGVLLDAIINGLQRGISPRDVFAVPEIQQSISDHVQLRQRQGLGPAAAIREYQALQTAIDRFVSELAAQNPDFSDRDALDIIQQIPPYLGELFQIVVSQFWPG